jgi:hypothetical protein
MNSLHQNLGGMPAAHSSVLSGANRPWQSSRRSLAVASTNRSVDRADDITRGLVTLRSARVARTDANLVSVLHPVGP